MAVTLENYVKSRPDVKAARKKLSNISAEYNQLKATLVPPGAGAEVTRQRQTRLQALQQQLNDLQNQVAQAELKASTYYCQNIAKIQAKAEAKETAKLKDELTAAVQYRQELANKNLDTSVLDSQIQGLNDRINKTGKYAPEKIPTAETRRPSMAPEKFDFTKYSAEVSQKINTAGQFIAQDLTPEQRLTLSQSLKDAGYDVEPSANYSEKLVAAYRNVLTKTIQRGLDFGRAITPEEMILVDKGEVAAGAKSNVDIRPLISSPTSAAAYVNSTFQSLLGRDATPKELSSLTKKLIKAQSDPKNAQKTVYTKDASGKQVATTTTGLDASQFLADIVKAMPEYDKRQMAARSLTEQDLSATARANGLNLETDFGKKTVAEWVKRVQNGEKIDIFNNLIRQTAKTGMPDNVKKMIDDGLDLETIYAPYKRVMAGTLEVDPGSISLDDPTLRAAITPEGEVPIYNFQRLVRKDPRWEYTNNARDEVAQITQRILKDFGFQG